MDIQLYWNSALVSTASFSIVDIVELGLKDATVLITEEVTLKNVFVCSTDSIISLIGALCLC